MPNCSNFLLSGRAPAQIAGIGFKPGAPLSENLFTNYVAKGIANPKQLEGPHR